MKDVAVIGAGIAGMATAARLQAKGLSTIVFEAHSHIGGGDFRLMSARRRWLISRRAESAANCWTTSA